MRADSSKIIEALGVIGVYIGICGAYIDWIGAWIFEGAMVEWLEWFIIIVYNTVLAVSYICLWVVEGVVAEIINLCHQVLIIVFRESARMFGLDVKWWEAWIADKERWRIIALVLVIGVGLWAVLRMPTEVDRELTRREIRIMVIQ